MRVCVYWLADDAVHPGGVGLWDLDAGEGAGLDYEVVDAQLDVLGLHLLQREHGHINNSLLWEVTTSPGSSPDLVYLVN